MSKRPLPLHNQPKRHRQWPERTQNWIKAWAKVIVTIAIP
jgi:hypothetical protein